MRPFEQPTRWAGGVVVLLLALLLGLTGPALAQAPAGQVVVILEARGVIDPVVAPYVNLGLDTANSTDAPLVIILLDPPGGLATALRAIVQVILISDNPVVFVKPSGTCGRHPVLDKIYTFTHLLCPFLGHTDHALNGDKTI